jgi:hypothetical protein
VEEPGGFSCSARERKDEPLEDAAARRKVNILDFKLAETVSPLFASCAISFLAVVVNALQRSEQPVSAQSPVQGYDLAAASVEIGACPFGLGRLL